MYPTVNSLMNLWSFVTAREIKVSNNCQTEIEALLRQLCANPENLFKPDTWKSLPAFVQVIPNGDILPSRGKYNAESNDWQVAVNYLYGNRNNSSEALWFSLPDVVVSVLLTNQIPKIVNAFRIEAYGKLKGLKSTKLRGAIKVDPKKKDFFRVVIEERQRLSKRTMHRLESERKTTVTCHGIDEEPFNCRAAHPDEPGEYCFPPLASLITGAARLMLALLESSVAKLGGTYAMEDTDSMAIVATERGGTIPCPGGNRGVIKALSWKQVDEISERFSDLNPRSRRRAWLNSKDRG